MIWIAPRYEWKTAFRKKNGLFENTLGPFRLTNAPATLQEMIDVVFEDMEACIWYLDDILIYGGETEGEHQRLVEKVLLQCVQHRLAGNLIKFEFHVKQTIFVGHIVNG